jgi:hypothetical protein
MTASGVNHDVLQLQALIGRAVPGRPIGPWSRRTGAPGASATRRDRNPSVGPRWVRSRWVNHGQQRAGAVTRRSLKSHVATPTAF